MPKCKICNQKFEKVQQIQPTCFNYDCMVAYANRGVQKIVRREKKLQAKEKRDFYNNSKVDLKKAVQPLINEYARKRDFLANGHRCVTCGITTGKMDGGHFLPTSSYSAIRYNVNQIHQQCVKCNRYNYGMPKEYRVFMIDKYDEKYVESLESTKNIPRLYTIEYYQRLKKIIQKKLKRLNKKIKDLNNERI